MFFHVHTAAIFYPSVVRDLLSPYASGLLVDCSFLTDTLTRRYLARGTFLFFFFESRVTRAWVIGFWRTSNLYRTLLFHIARAALHSYAVDSHLSRTVPTIPMTGRSVHYTFTSSFRRAGQDRTTGYDMHPIDFALDFTSLLNSHRNANVLGNPAVSTFI